MKDEKPNIYPPEIFDPLLPGGIPSRPDGTEKPMTATEIIERNAKVDALVAGEVVASSPEEATDLVCRAADQLLGRGTAPAPIVAQGGPAGGMLATPAPDPEGVAQDAYLGKLAREAETWQPCAHCGKYLVKLDGFCPGCGAVR